MIQDTKIRIGTLLTAFLFVCCAPAMVAKVVAEA
jgi:hypothetical protein